ncbi:hypothetical protein GTQ34_07305 [Muricauda sp. JGD-17]|uniref:Uncharacterized protein n=1 Tax=Flagellimonas ochracea TaxID=2696472 RepID=A0A964WXE2_9FLAO|nr:hypothetical protein [Allomuricauda ochracea]NAY91718.1 hypothetical protein [Allomuricauda ochracea]
MEANKKNIVALLERIKIFSDFKRSGLSSIDEFWAKINRNEITPFLPNQKLGFDPPKADFGQSEELMGMPLPGYHDAPGSEIYREEVQESILISLEEDQINLQGKLTPELLKTIILQSVNLQEFLSIQQEVLADFFKLHGASASNDLLPPSSDEHENPFPRLFTNHGYKFYLLLKEKFISNKDDYAYVFRKMTQDGFIYQDVKQSIYIDFVLETDEVEIEKVKSLHQISSQKRNSLYSQLKDLFLSRTN